MYVCPKCGKEYKKDMLRRCNYCKKVIGCNYCLSPGTLEYRYCDEHNPKPKKNKDEEILKFIKIFNKDITSDEPLYKHAVLQLTKIASEEEGLNKIIALFKNETEKNNGSDTVIEGLIDVFENVRNEKVIEPIVEYINNSYKNDNFAHLDESIELLFKIKTDKAIEKIKELSIYPSVEIRMKILNDLSEISKDDETNPKILEIYNQMLSGRSKEYVENIYSLIDNLTNIDYRNRDNAVRELAEMDSKKELVEFLDSSNPHILKYTIMALALKNGLKKNNKETEKDSAHEDDTETLADTKIFGYMKHEISFVMESVILYLKSKEMYDKIFEMVNNDSIDVKISALDALIEGGELAKKYIDKIMESGDEFEKNYVSNEELRYAENVKKEIALHDEYAQDFIIANEKNEAIEEYNEILKIDKNNSNAYLNLGQIYYEIYHYKEAEEYVKKHLEISPDSFEGWNLLGRIYNTKGMEKEAIDVFKKSIAVKNDILPHLFLGEIAQKNKNFDEAIEEYRDILKIEERPSIRLRLIEILRKQGKKDEAINELQKGISIFPDKIDFYKQLSTMLLDEQKLSDAEKLLRIACNKFPDDVEIAGMLASVLFYLNKYSESEHTIKKIFAENPDIIKSRDHAILHEILSRSLSEQGKMTEAARELKTARNLDPSLNRRR